MLVDLPFDQVSVKMFELPLEENDIGEVPSSTSQLDILRSMLAELRQKEFLKVCTEKRKFILMTYWLRVEV